MTQELINNLNGILQGLKLDAECKQARQHRHFAFYDLSLGNKCRLSQIENRAKEIALSLRSKNDPFFKILREQGLVRLQVVVEEPKPLPLLDILPDFHGSGSLPFLLGETDEGELLSTDMAQNPHLLIAGSTGTGKSVLLHNLIANAVYTSQTKKIKLFLVDPKGVEFSAYAIPEMSSLINQITNEYAPTLEMLEYLIERMEQRYEMLKKLGLQSVEQAPELFPSIMVIIDEVSDLIFKDDSKKKFEGYIVRLAQKCRAAGIYLVLATQHPSVKVLTGLIKANFEARLACKVNSRTDSQVILDYVGAQNLVGRGDAIIKNRAHDLVRFQVAYVDTKGVLDFWKQGNL